MTILLEPDADAAETYRFALPGQVVVVDSVPAVTRALSNSDEVLVVVGSDVDLAQALELTERQRVERPGLGVVLLRRRLDVGLLGQALRSGVREVVNPDDLAAVSDACRRSLQVSEQLGSGAGTSDRAEARVTVVFSAKGGCGKTTVATNLAVALTDAGRSRVCLVDLDLAFGDVAITLQLMPARTIVDAVAMAGHLDEQGVASLVTHHSPGLDTICAPLEPGEAERIPVSVVAELLRVLKGMYDHVVIDTPPAFTEHVLAAFDTADRYVLLATLDIPALKNLRVTLDMLDLLGYPRESWLVVLNRSDSKVGLSISDVEHTLRTGIAALIPSSRAVPASINKGVPIQIDEPNHQVSLAIKVLASRCAPTADERTSGRSGGRGGGRSRPRRMAMLRRGRH
jgi:pilus assembly protein CpaE